MASSLPAGQQAVPPKYPASSGPGTVTTEHGDVAQLTYEPLDEAALIRAVKSPKAGAVCCFVGYTRDTFDGKPVLRLEYEAYTSLALNTLRLILLGARADPFPPPSLDSLRPSPEQEEEEDAHAHGHHARSPSAPALSFHPPPLFSPPSRITRIAIQHRLGDVPVGHPSILVAVSSQHRKQSFEVCEWALEEVKKRVQIWKREIVRTGPECGEVVDEAAWKENFPPDLPGGEGGAG